MKECHGSVTDRISLLKLTAVEIMSQKRHNVAAVHLSLTYGLTGPYTHCPPQDLVHLTKRCAVIGWG